MKWRCGPGWREIRVGPVACFVFALVGPVARTFVLNTNGSLLKAGVSNVHIPRFGNTNDHYSLSVYGLRDTTQRMTDD